VDKVINISFVIEKRQYELKEFHLGKPFKPCLYLVEMPEAVFLAVCDPSMNEL
jgi:hypothetical protein